MRLVGNLVHESVPDFEDEKDNEIVDTWGNDIKQEKTDKTIHHHELLQMIGGYEPKRGQKIAGHRGYFLTGYGMMLNMALVNYGLQFLVKKKYTPIQPPFFVKKQIMEDTCQIGEFEENLYRIVTKKDKKEEGEVMVEDKKKPVQPEEDQDLFLIATSEQPISALYKDETLEPVDLPKRFVGYSTCFRKEAGAHGKDTWGIYRVHQFEKVRKF